MTYQGSAKGLGIGRLPEGIGTVYARNQNYNQYQQSQEASKQRESLFAKYAPANPVKRIFYNMEKRRLAK